MQTKSDRLDMRLTSEQKEDLERAAAISGQPLTSFALSHLLEKAWEIIERHQRTVLSVRDGQEFLKILDGASPPAPALVKALRRRQAKRA
jgi:uncharacterized protein (DUF1778 family)